MRFHFSTGKNEQITNIMSESAECLNGGMNSLADAAELPDQRGELAPRDGDSILLKVIARAPSQSSIGVLIIWTCHPGIILPWLQFGLVKRVLAVRPEPRRLIANGVPYRLTFLGFKVRSSATSGIHNAQPFRGDVANTPYLWGGTVGPAKEVVGQVAPPS